MYVCNTVVLCVCGAVVLHVCVCVCVCVGVAGFQWLAETDPWAPGLILARAQHARSTA